MKTQWSDYRDTVLINYPDVVKVGELESLLLRSDAGAKRRLVHVIYHRLNNRYVRPLNEIPAPMRSGFLTMAAACLMIEALQSFRQGYEYTKWGAGKKCFSKFFSENEAFKCLHPYSNNFYSKIRCGILHQAETYGNWLIWLDKELPLFFLRGEIKVINAEKFLNELEKSIKKYRADLEAADWNNRLWVRAKRKLTKICEHCKPEILQLNLHREFFAKIAAGNKRTEYRSQTQYWKKRLTKKEYDVIQFRNGYATNAPEMQVEFLGVRRIKRDGKNVYAIRLGKILKIKRWQKINT